jgi:hypothetical protein
MSKFNKDLTQGQYFEALYSKLYLTEKNVESSKDKGKFKDWDIKTTDDDGTITLYEVKSDGKGHFTGNVCIEYACSDKPSSINATKADWWIHFIPSPNYTDNKYRLIKIQTGTLRQMISDKKYIRFCNGGDGYRASMYLFPLSLFDEYIIANTLT